jgi:hypothetical protein
MRRWVILTGIGGLLLTGIGRAVSVRPEKKEVVCLDLQPKANQKRQDNFHNWKAPGNNLAKLPQGEQHFAGVKFSVGAKLIQLGGKGLKDKPGQVAGIKVGRAFTRLHILHATGWWAEEGTVIGSYTVRYADRTTRTIDIAYGKDVRNWWTSQDPKAVTRGKVAWEGTNAVVEKQGTKIRLFLTSWQNPFPKKKVVAIDYHATMKTNAAPFCVALTVEGK